MHFDSKAKDSLGNYLGKGDVVIGPATTARNLCTCAAALGTKSYRVDLQLGCPVSVLSHASKGFGVPINNPTFTT